MDEARLFVAVEVQSVQSEGRYEHGLLHGEGSKVPYEKGSISC